MPRSARSSGAQDRWYRRLLRAQRQDHPELQVRFIREGTIIWKGEIDSLRRFKDDVREVAAGFECGIGLSDFQDLRPGDIIETYDAPRDPEDVGLTVQVLAFASISTCRNPAR